VFAAADAAGVAGVRFDHHTTAEVGHGRHEGRSASVVCDPPGVPPEWPDAAAVVSVLRERAVNGAAATTVHYYLSSHTGTAEATAATLRGHWGIESGWHWVLDAAFREGESRTCDLNAGADLALLRRVGVSLLKRGDAKGRVETRRLMAAWGDDVLLHVLQGIPAVPSA
jgi:predicted transposase YbfD/YdcC